MHEEIKSRKKISEILSSFESFEQLKGMCLLFNKDSEYYKFSGIVTAALLDYDNPDNKISILAIKTSDNWFTFKNNRVELVKMFSYCDAFIGKTPEESFLIEEGMYWDDGNKIGDNYKATQELLKEIDKK